MNICSTITQFFLYYRERENHSIHLKTIEAELDVQVAKVEASAREKAKRDYEEDKKRIQVITILNPILIVRSVFSFILIRKKWNWRLLN